MKSAFWERSQRDWMGSDLNFESISKVLDKFAVVTQPTFIYMTNLQNLSVEQLRKVVAIKEMIESLEAKLANIAGGRGPGRPRSLSALVPVVRRRRKMSAAAKARIAAGQRARWAKIKGTSPKAVTEVKTKRKVSAATKARLAAVARARWAKVKASGKSAL